MSFPALSNNTTAYPVKSNLQLSGNYCVAAIKRHKNSEAGFAVEIRLDVEPESSSPMADANKKRTRVDDDLASSTIAH